MKERPILFSGPMVRALLDGSKTQTRRVVKLPHSNPLGQWEPTTIGGPNGGRTKQGLTIPEQGAIWHTRTGDSLMCPYGAPGNRLWVREAWRAPLAYELSAPRNIESGTPILYESGGGTLPEFSAGKYRPPMFMPRWASRITLEVIGVRVERLQAISEADALAEGIHQQVSGWFSVPGIDGAGTTARAAFALLWQSINGAGSWDANPWVWVVEFKRVT